MSIACLFIGYTFPPHRNQIEQPVGLPVAALLDFQPRKSPAAERTAGNAPEPRVETYSAGVGVGHEGFVGQIFVLLLFRRLAALGNRRPVDHIAVNDIGNRHQNTPFAQQAHRIFHILVTDPFAKAQSQPQQHLAPQELVHHIEIGRAAAEAKFLLRFGSHLPLRIMNRPFRIGGSDLQHRGAGNVGLRLPGGLVQPLAVSRVDPVVGIHEKDEFARRGVESPVAGAAQAAVLLRNDPDAVVLRRIAVQDVDRPVGTSVVDADDLDPAQGLSHHAVQASGQKRLDIVDRNDNADFRFHRLSNIIFYRLGDSFAVERRRNDAESLCILSRLT